MQNISFNYSPAQVKEIYQAEKSRFQKTVEDIVTISQTQATFHNSLLKLEVAGAEFSNTVTPVIFLKYVSENEIVRKVADICETDMQHMFVDLFVREDLFKVIRSIKDDSKNLAPEMTRLLDEYLVYFKRNGLELDPEKRKSFIEKKKHLVAMEAEFSNNLAAERDFLELKKEELEGLPDSYIAELKKTENGHFKITLDYPHYFPFMENATNSDARRRLELKFNCRGGEKNTSLLEKAIVSREELANMLGYKTHADFVLERRMAKQPKTVETFLNELVKTLVPAGRECINKLAKVKSQVTNGKEPEVIRSWDWRFYNNYVKKTQFKLDTEVIREYFPIDVVLKGLFEIYQTLFSLTFIEEMDAPTWHSSVRKFRVERNGNVVAGFYMDLFPREGKYGHAAAFTLQSGYEKLDRTYQTPLSSIVANFSPPAQGKPSLLEHSEVETLFHEFGHIMHQVLTTAKYPTFSGTNVKTDFVEAPSQMLENWVWEKEVLHKLSGHYKDHSKKLPSELIEKLLAAKDYNQAVHYLRQLSFAILDLNYHTHHGVDTTAEYAKTMKEIMQIPIQDGTMPQASFGHLMGGYDSGYYSYLWSEVYAQDMFTRFEKEGLLNPSTGADYTKWILQPGGEQEPYELVKGFLGREPNNAAFLKSLGIN